MKSAILLGAGSSVPAGFPPTRCLTDLVLSGKGVERHSSGSYQLRGGGRHASEASCPRPYTISSSNRPYPITDSFTWSRFWIAQTRAGTGCTTGTCRSCSRSSMMSSVRQPEPSM